MNKSSTAMLTRHGSASVRRGGNGPGRGLHRVVAFVVAILVYGSSALAQPSAASPTPTPQNPNWCAGVPASPPPPTFDARYGQGFWPRIREECINGTNLPENCNDVCREAQDLWERWKLGAFNRPTAANSPPPTPSPTEHLKVPLPGGGSVEKYSGSVPPPPGMEPPI